MLKSIRNSLVLTSVLYAALGVVLMIFPGTALRLACTLIGLVTLGYGLTRVLSWRRLSQEAGGYSQRFDLFLGVVLGLLGLFLLVTPQVLVSIIPVALGLYVLVDSVSAGKRALDMKALGYQRWWAALAAALVLAAFGAVMVLRPFQTVESLVVFIGVGFVFDGVSTLAGTLAADRAYRDK